MTPQAVLTRGLASSFFRCLQQEPVIIDVQRAQREHRAYVEVLMRLVPQVIELPADENCPDCCFVEDMAVWLRSSVMICRSGQTSRRDEAAAVREALQPYGSAHAMVEGGTFDGGDVLRAGNVLLAGRSSRGNDAGYDDLVRRAAAEDLRVVPVEVRKGLHLKSACTLATPSLGLYDPAVLAVEDLEAADIEWCAAPESAGANVLAIGDVVLVSAAAPKTRALLDARQVKTIALDLTEIHKADGALTCSSVRIPPAGGWVT